MNERDADHGGCPPERHTPARRLHVARNTTCSPRSSPAHSTLVPTFQTSCGGAWSWRANGKSDAQGVGITRAQGLRRRHGCPRLSARRGSTSPRWHHGQHASHRTGRARDDDPGLRVDELDTEVPFRQPIAEINEMLKSARADGGAVRLGVPGGHLLVPLMNSELGRGQHIDRIYWSVSHIALSRIIDVVRTILVELVAEIRAGSTSAGELPTSSLPTRLSQWRSTAAATASRSTRFNNSTVPEDSPQRAT